MPDGDYLGYLKYDGAKVADGTLDAREAARALLGFDSALRYVISRETASRDFQEMPIPVQIRTGSWEAVIPHDVESWITAAVGLGFTTYLGTAAKKLAENDFKDIGLKHLFVNAFKSIQWLIRIGKHLNSFRYRQVAGTKWKNKNTEIGIPNEKGEYLYVPVVVFDIYSTCPVKLLSEMSSVVNPICELHIGVNDNGKQEDVSINDSEKAIFYVVDSPIEILFPDLVHGETVQLEGIVTKGNETTNGIGFRYQGHILQCEPREGSIVRFKPHLFLPCRIFGTISRMSQLGEINEPRPKIIFDDLQILDESSGQRQLGL
jgi:hypothetical protein